MASLSGSSFKRITTSVSLYSTLWTLSRKTPHVQSEAVLSMTPRPTGSVTEDATSEVCDFFRHLKMPMRA
jgi:hypothetical protein